MKTHIVKQTKHELRHDISKHVNFRKIKNCTGPLHDESKLQVDGKNNKLKKIEKS